jgi:trk system potassium uptake protein TrkA
MRVIVVGCGRVGSALANQLYKKGHLVTVIDQKASAFDNLPVDFRGRTIEGDVLSRDVLHRAEIEDSDALAAVTSSDSLNALIAHIARTEYQVSKVVSRNYDPRQLLLQKAFDIPVVASASWGVQRIEELFSDDPLRVVLSDSQTNFAVYQLEVPEIWHGRSSQELLPEGRIKTIALRRADQTLPISNAQSLETGDLIYLSADPGEIEALRQRLVFQKERLE